MSENFKRACEAEATPWAVTVRCSVTWARAVLKWMMSGLSPGLEVEMLASKAR